MGSVIDRWIYRLIVIVWFMMFCVLLGTGKSDTAVAILLTFVMLTWRLDHER